MKASPELWSRIRREVERQDMNIHELLRTSHDRVTHIVGFTSDPDQYYWVEDADDNRDWTKLDSPYPPSVTLPDGI